MAYTSRNAAVHQASRISKQKDRPCSCILYKLPPEVRIQIYQHALQVPEHDSNVPFQTTVTNGPQLLPEFHPRITFASWDIPAEKPKLLLETDIRKWPRVIRALEPWTPLYMECLAEFFSTSWAVLNKKQVQWFCKTFPLKALLCIRNMVCDFASMGYHQCYNSCVEFKSLGLLKTYELFIDDRFSPFMKATNITNLHLNVWMRKVRSKRQFHNFVAHIRQEFQKLEQVVIEIRDARNLMSDFGILNDFFDYDFRYEFKSSITDQDYYSEIYNVFVCDLNNIFGCWGKLLTVSEVDRCTREERWFWEHKNWKKSTPASS